jgi:hypothetical protein
MVIGKGYPETFSPEDLNFFKRCYLSALVIAWALRPPRMENGGDNAGENSLSQPPHIASTKEEIRFYLGDLNRGVDRQGDLKLLFSGSLPIAAPFLLFRLKRSGFSDCRVLMTGKGLLLSATR